MTKRWIAKLVVGTLIISSLTACAGKSAGNTAGSTTETADQSTQQTEAAPTDDANAVDYSSGTPWPYIDLEGVVTPDMPTDPKDNFALYANKDKILNLKIPEGRPFGGAFMNLVQQQSEDVKNMFLGEAPEEHDAKLAFDLFWLMMDWDSRNALGVAPLKEEVDRVEEISTIDELMAYFVETPAEKQLSSLWSTEVNADLNDASRKIFWISDAGVLLGDKCGVQEPHAFWKDQKRGLHDAGEEDTGQTRLFRAGGCSKNRQLPCLRDHDGGFHLYQ